MIRIGHLILPPETAVRWRRLELVIWAFLLSLAYYPGPWGFLAWFALARPFGIIASLDDRDSLSSGYWFGFWFAAFSIYWVAWVTLPGTIAAVVIVGFYYALVFKLFNKAYRLRPLWGIISAPFLWVGMEYFRTLSEFAFPWSDLGYTQSYYLTILQIVSVVSVHGLSFLIIVVNVLIWQATRRQSSLESRISSGIVAALLIIVLWAYGWIAMPAYAEEGDYEVAMLQGAVPVEVKWRRGNEWYSLYLYDSLARSVGGDAELYIWPETSAPCYLNRDYRCRRAVAQTARATRAFHLIGAQAVTTDSLKRRTHNSCFLFNPDGNVMQQYDKVRLVPFSEHVPYQDHVPFMQKKFLREYLTFLDGPGVRWWSDFYPGDSMVLFETRETQFGVLICFESTFPEFCRAYIRRGAHFIVGITNDTWFGTSVGIHMHSRIFVTRLVENRSWGVRVANSGLSYIVDPYGRLSYELPLTEVAATVGRVGLPSEYSVFTRYGDVVGRASWLYTLSLAAILVLLWFVRKLHNR